VKPVRFAPAVKFKEIFTGREKDFPVKKRNKLKDAPKGRLYRLSAAIDLDPQKKGGLLFRVLVGLFKRVPASAS